MNSGRARVNQRLRRASAKRIVKALARWKPFFGQARAEKRRGKERGRVVLRGTHPSRRERGAQEQEAHTEMSSWRAQQATRSRVVQLSFVRSLIARRRQLCSDTIPAICRGRAFAFFPGKLVSYWSLGRVALAFARQRPTHNFACLNLEHFLCFLHFLKQISFMIQSI